MWAAPCTGRKRARLVHPYPGEPGWRPSILTAEVDVSDPMEPDPPPDGIPATRRGGMEGADVESARTDAAVDARVRLEAVARLGRTWFLRM
jgi:hypothetical protein